MSDYGSTQSQCVPDFVLDPDSTDEFEFNLVTDLDGDTIESYEIVLPDGLTLEASDNTDTTVRVTLSGADCWRTYRVICRYTTAAGRTRDKTMRFIGRQQ